MAPFFIFTNGEPDEKLGPREDPQRKEKPMAQSFKMKFYLECLKQAQEHPYGSYTVLYDDGREDLMLLTVYPGLGHNPNFAGFGGHKFKFKTANGEIVESNNCWHRGNRSDIPKRLVGKFETWTKA